MKVECLQEKNGCNECPFYNKEASKCKATVTQIRVINKKIRNIEAQKKLSETLHAQLKK
jgi:hypothetical protein